MDIKKIFESYYKKEQAEKEFKNSVASYTNERKVYIDGLKKITEELNKLQNDAQNQAIDKKTQDEKKKAFGTKFSEYQMKQKELDEFDRTRKVQLADSEKRILTSLLEDIKKVIAEKGKAEGYTMIVDRSGVTAIGAPAVPFMQDNLDITDAIIKTLNASKPAETGAKPK